jgi:hypothetical protein
MKVSELIEILKELPQDAEVIASTQNGGTYSVTDVDYYNEPFDYIELS